jgi:hypothetical protein
MVGNTGRGAGPLILFFVLLLQARRRERVKPARPPSLLPIFSWPIDNLLARLRAHCLDRFVSFRISNSDHALK